MIGCDKGLSPCIALRGGNGAQSGVIPGLFRERVMRRMDTFRTCRIINVEEEERPRGAGTCLSDINDRTAHRCAHLSLPCFPAHNPGWEYHRFPFPKYTPEESDGFNTPHENRPLSDIPEQELTTFNTSLTPPT